MLVVLIYYKERYAVSLCIQSKSGRIWPRITPNKAIFHAVKVIRSLQI